MATTLFLSHILIGEWLVRVCGYYSSCLQAVTIFVIVIVLVITCHNLFLPLVISSIGIIPAHIILTHMQCHSWNNNTAWYVCMHGTCAGFIIQGFL